MKYYEPLIYIVPPEEDGWILKTILQKRMLISRSLLSRLKLTEMGITLNGERKYISVHVESGDLVEVRMEQEVSTDILPQDLPISVIYEDEHLLIVNKEAGMIVHPTHGHYTNTLANGVVHYWQQAGKSYRFRPVHRLDQDTSGVLAIAKNPYIHQHISEQMKEQKVEKQYVSLVHGVISEDEGKVDEPIDRDPESPHVRIVTPTGYPAVTHFRVEKRFSDATQVRLWLETGRTHQIRVHMKHLGYPLIGDKMYGAAAEVHDASQLDMDRQALHAVLLGFNHPISKHWVEFKAPLPEDMKACLQHTKETENNMSITIYQYPQCDTCRNALKWLKNRGTAFNSIHIVENPPAVETLTALIQNSGLDIKKFFNTSGVVYKEMNLKDKLPAMSDEEKVQLLASNGKLIKRPIITDGTKVTVGFKEAEMAQVWG
jgi:23S rRNA pseudouridine1911/1915/1917 synthase